MEDHSTRDEESGADGGRPYLKHEEHKEHEGLHKASQSKVGKACRDPKNNASTGGAWHPDSYEGPSGSGERLLESACLASSRGSTMKESRSAFRSGCVRTDVKTKLCEDLCALGALCVSNLASQRPTAYPRSRRSLYPVPIYVYLCDLWPPLRCLCVPRAFAVHFCDDSQSPSSPQNHFVTFRTYCLVSRYGGIPS